VKARVLHLYLERMQRCVLHLRRKRMRHWVAEDTKTNRRIDLARDSIPVLEIRECVTIGSLLLVHQSFIAVIPSEVEESRGTTI
jgi:hypothetical protein